MVKIKSMIRKSVNCLVTLSLMFFVFLFVYACSSDADYSAKIEDNKVCCRIGCVFRFYIRT